MTSIEAKVFQAFRWWPIAELAETREAVTPRALAAILGAYLRVGAPDPLPDEEVLVD